jgi:tetratricopeptide (TPR) repeat protein
MDLSQREQLLADIADGNVALRDVGGLAIADIFAIARVGAAAMQGGRFSQAADVFQALCALEPDVAEHRLHLAFARQGEGDVDGALEAALQALDIAALAVDDVDTGEVQARALLLRAELHGRADRQAALDDLAAAAALTQPSARAVVDVALGRH